MKKSHKKWLVGVDEAGRGPLAGPVAVSALKIKDQKSKLKIFGGIRDSKKLSEKQRIEWFNKLKKLKNKGSIDYSVSFSSAANIDKKGITRAVREATARAVYKLKLNPSQCRILLDGTLFAPKKFKNQKTIIHGDNRVPIIAAASILAKVLRDRRMKYYAKKFPNYGFEIHKGYGTEAHYQAIKKFGFSKAHRRSFKTF